MYSKHSISFDIFVVLVENYKIGLYFNCVAILDFILNILLVRSINLEE